MNRVDRNEALKRADAALTKAGIGGLGRIREYVAEAIEKAAEDGRLYGRLEAEAEVGGLWRNP